MKKAALKLIPALCMLLISAMMLGTTTYAWFSMNSSVRATGMTVQAQNSNGYLLIDKAKEVSGVLTNPTISSMRSNPQTSVNFTETGTIMIKPAQFNPISSSGTPDTYFNTASNWYYKTADAPSSYVSSTSSNTLTALDGYVAKYEMWICLAEGSSPMDNLKATVNLTDDSGSNIMHTARVVVATSQNYEVFYNEHREANDASNTSAHNTGTVALWDHLTSGDAAPVKVTVYVFIDGEDHEVFTNNALNLAATSITIDFTATDGNVAP